MSSHIEDVTENTPTRNSLTREYFSIRNDEAARVRMYQRELRIRRHLLNAIASYKERLNRLAPPPPIVTTVQRREPVVPRLNVFRAQQFRHPDTHDAI